MMASRAVLFALLPNLALAAPLVLEAEISADAGTFFTVSFPVGTGIAELEVRHDDLSSANILDWGLLGPSDTFWGWGGGNSEPIIVGARASSRSYRSGLVATGVSTTLPTGMWKVLIGQAQVTQRPAKYRLEIETRMRATLTPQQREAYTPAEALEKNARWYAGDTHVHSLESGDARPSLDEIATFARSRGLDFVALSDHNTASHYDFINQAQARNPTVLLVPSVEFTTYAGHLNGFGASEFVPFWLGRDGVSMTNALRAFDAQGAIATINHPTLDLGSFCIGCAWQQPSSPSLVHAIEVGVGGWDETGSLFDESAIALWEALADKGFHLAAVGGSDDHRAGQALNQTQSALGSPTTMLYASELSVAGLTRALREGRTAVKLRGPDDPMVSLSSLTTLPRSADTLVGTSARLQAYVTGGVGMRLAWIENGQLVRDVAITSEPFVDEQPLEAPEGRSSRMRVEVRIGQLPRTVSSHVWLAPDSPPGPPVVVARETPRGCPGCTSSNGGLLLVAGLLLRRRR